LVEGVRFDVLDDLRFVVAVAAFRDSSSSEFFGLRPRFELESCFPFFLDDDDDDDFSGFLIRSSSLLSLSDPDAAGGGYVLPPPLSLPLRSWDERLFFFAGDRGERGDLGDRGD